MTLRPLALSRRRCGPAAASVAALLLASLVLVAPGSPAGAYPAANVELRGHGFGHGRGMGQHGALGYALRGWSYQQILDHYYGGTTMGTIDNISMSVRLVAVDSLDTIVVQDQSRATTSTNPGPTYRALRTELIGDNRFRVSKSDVGCGGPWEVITPDATGPVILRSELPASEDRSTMLQLCTASGTRWYRGHLEVVHSRLASDLGSRTVNHLPMESYLRGVVPRESPASWGTLGGGAGMHALRAQAVAARSYAFAQNRYAYAKICDTQACQVYGGAGSENTATTDTAVAETAGLVRRSNGAVVSAEYSSSTGGYTAGGVFPAVPDEGDTVAQNPNLDWTASVAVADVEAAYPAIGRLQSVDVVRRNGLGDFGGRVLDLVLVGTAGRQALTGNEFRSRFGLKSDWFLVTNNPSCGVAGYWVVAADGGIFSFGDAQFYGSMGARRLNQPVLGMAPTPNGGGYWLVAADGGIFSFGNAVFRGSTGNIRLNQPVVAMASSPTGNGYWLVARDGGIFAFGDAVFRGSTGAIRLNQPVVGMAATPSGNGYWLVASDGGIFAFGDAQFYGSTGAIRLNQPIVAMAPTASGRGYWLLAADGGVFAFGDAAFLGSLPGIGAAGPARGFQATKGAGYLVANDAGRVFAFGDAPRFGDVATVIPGYRGGVRGLSARYSQ